MMSTPMVMECAVMFVDMVDSTQLKHREKDSVVYSVIGRLYELIDRSTHGKWIIKFTGDGAMVVFDKGRSQCRTALKAAEQIIQGVDSDNLRFDAPRIHIRVGIATGMCLKFGISDAIGATIDLAARLCAEADCDGILVDQTTKSASRLDDQLFEPCQRRLLLKGVPLSPKNRPDHFYHFRPLRFVTPPIEDPHSRGVLALYPNRVSLNQDFTPDRLVRLAVEDSIILVAGRTLITWTDRKVVKVMKKVGVPKGVNFRFLISSKKAEEASIYLDEQQTKDIGDHLPRGRTAFRNLSMYDPDHFQPKETDLLILDGITCGWILLPGEKQKGSSKGKLVVLQDINAASGHQKATLLWACVCSQEGEEGRNDCIAHGLYKRTKLIYDKGRVLR